MAPTGRRPQSKIPNYDHDARLSTVSISPPTNSGLKLISDNTYGNPYTITHYKFMKPTRENSRCWREDCQWHQGNLSRINRVEPNAIARIEEKAQGNIDERPEE